MKGFPAFYKKEWMETQRSGKLIVIFAVFLLLGIMNPAITKLTPWMMDMLSEQLSEAGMTVSQTNADALSSWTQFYKNMLIGFIVLICIYSGILTREYRAGTLVIMLTKGLPRNKVLFAKYLLMVSVWTAAYWLCFGVTYGINECFWDNGIAENLLVSAAYMWIFGLWVISVLLMFSAIFNSSSGVMLCTGGVILAAYLISLLPKLSKYSPMRLTEGTSLVYGAAVLNSYTAAVIITAALSMIFLLLSVVIFNKKKL